MRDLTNIELQTVSGAIRVAPAPMLRVPTSIFGVPLNRRAQAALGEILLALRGPVKTPAK
jgi:hypothetical protein